MAGSSRDNRQPYEHILNRLSGDPNRAVLKTDLARVAASLLNDYCEGRLDEYGSDDVPFLLYNLLRLCAGLCRPAELGRPLRRVYDALAADNMPSGVHSEEIRVALQAALIPNQAGPDTKHEWMNLIAGTDSVLGWGEADGFLGVLYMPEVCGPLERPWMAAIEEALRLLTKQYENDQDEFQEYTDRARRFWLSYAPWDFELELAALNSGWPAWAIQRLEVHTTRSPKGRPEWLVSDYVKDSVPCGFGVTTIQSWPDARISLVQADPDSVGIFFEAVGASFDKLCRKLRGQFQEDQSLRYLVAEVLRRGPGSSGKTGAKVLSWDEARARIMAKIGMQPAHDTSSHEAESKINKIDVAAKDVARLIRQYQAKLNDIRGADATPNLNGPRHLLEGLAANIVPAQEIHPAAG